MTMWFVGGFFGGLGSLTAGIVFKKYVKKPAWKMMYAFFGCSASALCAIFIPRVTVFPLLVALFSLRWYLKQLWVTASLSFIVYILGPARSKSYVQGFMVAVSVGALVGPSVVKEYLPDMDDVINFNVCPNGTFIPTNSSSHDDLPFKSLETPYVILAGTRIAIACLYLLMILHPVPMPVFEEEEESRPLVPKEKLSSTIGTRLFLIGCFFSASGMERIVFSVIFTFALCGPLKLPPDVAILCDIVHNSCFLIGRIAAVGVVRFVSPKRMFMCSIIGSLLVGSCLAIVADYSATALYACAALFGLAVSWNMGSAYSWCVDNIDMTGVNSTAPFIGRTIGALVCPATCGVLFRRVSPMSMWYFLVGIVVFQAGCALVLNYRWTRQAQRNLEAQI